MQEQRESLVSLQTASTLTQSRDENSYTPSSLKERATNTTTPPVNKSDDGVVPDTSTEETLSSETTTFSDQEEIKTCDISEMDISSGGCKGVRRCATFPRSTEGDATVPKSVPHGKKEPVMEPPSYERSKSLPTYLKSALKGSRAQQPGGASSRSGDLHVRWAPDVYDPPVTSQSHTVQSHSGQKGGGGGSSSKGKKRSKKKDKRRNKG